MAGAVRDRRPARSRHRSGRAGAGLRAVQRRLADSNRRTRLCRPLPNHSAKAPGRGMVSALVGTPFGMTAEAYLPERLSLGKLRDAVQGCRGCPLYANATQAVFGEGTSQAEVM